MPGHYGKTGTKKKKPMSKGLSKLPKAVQKKILKKKLPWLTLTYKKS